jgi:hypothetical protein
MEPNENLGDLERAIGQLRERRRTCVKTLATENQPAKTTTAIEYLVKLQAGIEAMAKAIEDERWARERTYEFQGE